MPNPAPQDVHLDVPLSNLSTAFLQSVDKFAHRAVFPPVPVPKQSNKYYKFDKDDFRRDDMEKRAPGTRAKPTGYGLSTDSYSCEEWANEHPIPDESRANADDGIDLDRAAQELLMQRRLIRGEREFVSSFLTTGLWDGEVDGASSATAASSFDPTNASNNDAKYWNLSGSTPIADLRYGIFYVEEQTGYAPNVLVLGPHTWRVLQDHADFLDRIEGGSSNPDPAKVNTEQLARILEIDKVVVSRAGYNSAPQNGTASNSYIAGKHALLAYAPASPGIMTPSAGYTFEWTGIPGAEGFNAPIFRWRDQPAFSDVLISRNAFDMKLVSSALGYFFKDIVQ